jgi:hypothetical protein
VAAESSSRSMVTYQAPQPIVTSHNPVPCKRGESVMVGEGSPRNVRDPQGVVLSDVLLVRRPPQPHTRRSSPGTCSSRRGIKRQIDRQLPWRLFVPNPRRQPSQHPRVRQSHGGAGLRDDGVARIGPALLFVALSIENPP